jgi:casein kinase 1
MHTSSFVRGGSSSRRAVLPSSRTAGPTEVLDPSRTSANKTGPTSLRTSGGAQRSSPIASTDPKRTVSNRHLPPNLRNYEGVLKGVESLSFEVDQSQ